MYMFAFWWNVAGKTGVFQIAMNIFALSVQRKKKADGLQNTLAILLGSPVRFEVASALYFSTLVALGVRLH